jgi:hypothetical protein
VTGLDVRLARLEERVTELATDVARLDSDLGGAGRVDSVRGRLHVLENFNAAEKAAEAALSAVRSARGQQHAEKGQMIALVLTAINILAVVVLAVFK